MRSGLAAVVLLCGCGDDGQSAATDASVDALAQPMDARVDAAPYDALVAPAIDWSNWGNDCPRSSYGITNCKAVDGVSVGYCVLTGEPDVDSVFPGACRHPCYSTISHWTRCPADATVVESGGHSQGCTCAQIP